MESGSSYSRGLVNMLFIYFIFYGASLMRGLGPVWYVCLKTENCCLKIFVEIRVGEKMY